MNNWKYLVKFRFRTESISRNLSVVQPQRMSRMTDVDHVHYKFPEEIELTPGIAATIPEFESSEYSRQ